MKSKDLTLKNLGHVIRFAENINDELLRIDFLNAIIKLDELRERITKAKEPFLTNQDVVEYFKPIIDMLITFKPRLENQLSKFWNAQKDVAHQIYTCKNSTAYSPIKEIDEKMGQVIVLYDYLLSKLLDNRKDTTLWYAMFYCQILLTESIGFSFQSQFDKHLINYHLTNYDSNEIFSIDKKVKNRKRFVTDARAIRICLAHYYYRIDIEKSIIHFKGEKGLDYDKIFSFDEFLNFINDQNILYRSQYMIVLILSTMSDMKLYVKS